MSVENNNYIPNNAENRSLDEILKNKFNSLSEKTNNNTNEETFLINYDNKLKSFYRREKDYFLENIVLWEQCMNFSEEKTQMFCGFLDKHLPQVA